LIGVRALSRINAGAAQKEEFLDVVDTRTLQHVRLDHEIVIDKLTGIGAVCQNAPHLGGGQEYILGFFFLEEALHLVLAAQIKLFARARNKVRIAFGL